MMKILFINTGPWGTGSFTAARCLANTYIHMGHVVKIFFPDLHLESADLKQYYDHPELYEIWKFPIQNQSITLPVFPLMITDPNPRNPQGRTCKSLNESELDLYLTELCAELSRVVDAFQPDIIHCNHIWYPAWTIKNMGLPYVVTAHHSDQMGFKYDERARQPAIEAALGAEKIIAISPAVKQEIYALYPVDEGKVVLLPNTFESNIFKIKQVDKAAVLKKYGIQCDSNLPIINFSGRISLTKGMDLILRANKLLNPAMNIQIIVLGGGDLAELCNHMDPDTYSLHNMHFLGQQPPETLADIHNISSLSLMPSRTEGFGIAALEAMACGIPVITTNCGGPEEFAVGKIIEKESVPQLAEAIMELLNLPENDRARLSEQATIKAREYASDVIAAAHIALYEDIIG